MIYSSVPIICLAWFFAVKIFLKNKYTNRCNITSLGKKKGKRLIESSLLHLLHEDRHKHTSFKWESARKDTKTRQNVFKFETYTLDARRQKTVWKHLHVVPRVSTSNFQFPSSDTYYNLVWNSLFHTYPMICNLHWALLINDGKTPKHRLNSSLRFSSRCGCSHRHHHYHNHHYSNRRRLC